VIRILKQIIMKNLKLLAIIVFIGIVAVSCKKEEGPMGPAGPTGTNGTNGNANVTVYGFGPKTFTTTSFEHNWILPVSGGMADSSMIMPYYFQYDYWYPVGSVGYAGSFSSRFYLSPETISTLLFAQVRDADGSTYSGADVIWDSIRVFVIPANILKSTPAGKVNFKDYQSVSSYYDVK
jgi:hypothetical protein